MRSMVTLGIEASEISWESMREIFIQSGLHGHAESGPPPYGLYLVDLDMESPSFKVFYSLLVDQGIEWYERRYRMYFPEELEAAPLLWMRVTGLPHGQGGPACGTRYDLSEACPRCGTGARQVSGLRLKPSEVPEQGHVVATLHGEVVISSAVAQLFRNGGVSGVDLRAVKSEDDDSEVGWFQLLPVQVMPRMSSASLGIEREDPCPVCGRDGYCDDPLEPTEIVYNPKDLPPELPDVVMTWECFGNSCLSSPFEESRFAQPLILVKPRVYQILRSLGVQNVEFTPVAFGI